MGGILCATIASGSANEHRRIPCLSIQMRVQNTFTLSVRIFKNEKRFGENNGMFWVSFQYVARKMYNVISEACKLLQDDLHSGTICF